MVNSKKTLVAYLDILGYREIVSKQSPEYFYNELTQIFEILKKLCQIESSSVSDTRNKQITEILKTIQFNIVSDAIIVQCQFSEIETIIEGCANEGDSYFLGTSLFIHVISTLVVLFINTTGYLLRGGIDVGQFYENKIGGDLLKGNLVFSKALVEAYLLEQSAIYPRILISKKLYRLWRKSVKVFVEDLDMHKYMVRQSNDGEFYLDFYEVFSSSKPLVIEEWVKNILPRVASMVTMEKGIKKEVWKKWFWFKEYHNSKIKEFSVRNKENLERFLIN